MSVDATARHGESSPPKPRFVHLHLHSEYSLLDGGNTIDRLVNRVKELGMDAVAVTDHGNLHAAAEFYTKARSAGIKPILGIEAYIAPGDRTDKTQSGIKDGGFHLVLLAENNTGWANLMRLSSDSFIHGFYYKPRMDKSTLMQWNEGLIAINGHLGSSIAYHLINYVQSGREEHWHAALDEARWHAETFAPNDRGEPRFYIELQKHDTQLQMQINPHLLRLARELDLPLVCDNDAHFLRAEDWDAHDTLCCISMQKLKDESDRIVYPKDLYVKSPEEMAELFADVPEAVENTAKIADRCNVEIDFSVSHAPVVRVQREDYEEGTLPAFPAASMGPENVGSTEWFVAFCNQFKVLPIDEARDGRHSREDLQRECDQALRQLCEAGLYWRYHPDGLTDEIRKRLDWELKVIADKDISAYFLIVWDFVNYARANNIPAMARGSGVGTMVGYVLGLSNACPVKYGLLFERFTDPDRSEYPDIDIDLCQDGRAEVINYVRRKYGHVAQIITFGRLKARAAFKDVARVMGFTPVEAQRLSNLVPSELNITIDEAVQKEPELKRQYQTDDRVRSVVDHARALENHARHAGIHAAGVVIATQPLDTIVPLCKASGSDDIITQWDGPTCEKVGLLKMDFLGLRTLSTMERAKQIIRDTLPEPAIRAVASRGTTLPSPPVKEPGGDVLSDPLDLDRITFDDQRIFDLFRRGDTSGIFQFESGGMRQTLIDMKPDRLEDLIAANALYRPGPMELIDEYNRRKHGRSPVPRIHPIVDQYTDETYGIMVYQEQVMQIVHGLGGIPLRAAYSLIKAISKKKQKDIDAVRPKFMEGATGHGLTAKQADDLFDLILKFAGYGFNKSHSTGYAIIAYQTALLKAYFPAQYMAAVLTFESQAKKVEDWIAYLDECRRMCWPDHTRDRPHVGVEVRPPDINLSEAAFTVVFDEGEPRDNLHGHIRFGLGAIKGAGNAAVRAIISQREAGGPYGSLFDFCERIDLRSVNKATIEALVKCGAFDSLHGKERRAALVAAIEDAVKAGQTAAADRAAGQSTFFDSFDSSGDASASRSASVALPTVAPWSEMETLQNEKDVLGFYASGHPLDRHEPLLRPLCSHTIREVCDAEGEIPVILAGIVSNFKTRVSTNGRSAGQKMAFFSLHDRTGSMEGIAFSEAYSRYERLLVNDRVVVMVGRVDRRRAEPSIVVDRVLEVEAAPRILGTRLDIAFRPENGFNGDSERQLQTLSKALHDAATAQGGSDAAQPVEVVLYVFVDGRRVTILPSLLRVALEPVLIERLRSIVGEHNIIIRGGNPSRFMRNNNNGDNGGNGYRKSFANRARESETCASIDRY